MARLARVFITCASSFLVLPMVAESDQMNQTMPWDREEAASATPWAAKKAAWAKKDAAWDAKSEFRGNGTHEHWHKHQHLRGKPHQEEKDWAAKKAAWSALATKQAPDLEVEESGSNGYGGYSGEELRHQDGQKHGRMHGKPVQAEKEAWAAKKAAWSQFAVQDSWARIKKSLLQKSDFEDKVQAKKEAWTRDVQAEKEVWAESKAAWNRISTKQTSLRGLAADKEGITWSQKAADFEVEERGTNGYGGYGGEEPRHQDGQKHGRMHGKALAAFGKGSLGLLLLLAVVAVAAGAAFVAAKRCRGRRSVRTVTADGMLLASAPPAALSTA